MNDIQVNINYLENIKNILNNENLNNDNLNNLLNNNEILNNLINVNYFINNNNNQNFHNYLINNNIDLNNYNDIRNLLNEIINNFNQQNAAQNNEINHNVIPENNHHLNQDQNIIDLPQDNQDERIIPRCSICMENICTNVLIPCGHVCTCSQCGQQINRCPICREPFERRQALFFI